ncbi:MAG: Crp/Fnr family transcriptional regulator [Bacilli bacterium]|nr:Crp/Fnr family transcriptional regulator [Bacilli bacterium]
MKTFISILENHPKKIKTYNKNQVISFEGDLCNYVRIIVSGRILISSITISGQEIVYKELKQNDMFGHNLLFSNNPRYRGNVVCLESTDVYEFNKKEFIELLTNYEGFAEAFLQYQSEDSKKLNQQIKVQSLPSAEEKIFYLLQINKQELKFKSITELSRRLYISREATSRAVSKMIKEGKIKIVNKTILKNE